MFRVFGAQRPICALDSESLIAVAGIAPAGTCQPTVLQRLRFLPSMVTIGPVPAVRLGRWLGAWGERDPDRPHSHLGPVAVEPRLQGRGIGTQLMDEYCRGLDAAGEVSYLETDKRENVPFYERHGYGVIDEGQVIGRPQLVHAPPAATVGLTTRRVRVLDRETVSRASARSRSRPPAAAEAS